jgi:DNA-directed RNA polymerase specialized sigma24 family protein
MDETSVPVCKDDLKPDQFEGLLRQLDPDRERAGEKYEQVRRKLIQFFRWNDCFPEDDLADETFDRVVEKPLNEIHDVVAFLWGVAKNIVRECHRRPATVGIEELPPSRAPHTGDAELPIIERAERARQLNCLHKCVQQLALADRELFLEYEYFAGKSQNAEHLAARLAITMSALQSRAHRLKHRIEKCAFKCLSSSAKGSSQEFKRGGLEAGYE